MYTNKKDMKQFFQLFSQIILEKTQNNELMNRQTGNKCSIFSLRQNLLICSFVHTKSKPLFID